MDNSETLVKDGYENTGLHLVCVSTGAVIGTGRLNVANNIGIVSQMAVDEKYRDQGIGRKMMEIFLKKCCELNVATMRLSARKTAIGFYKKFGFKIVAESYPSKKTGIIHQNMIKHRKSN